MKNTFVALLLSLAALPVFAGGSSTVGAIGPSGLAMQAFDADSGVRAEVSQLRKRGFKALQRFPEVAKVESKNCHVPEGGEYVGGKATFTVCDSVFTMERAFKAPGDPEIEKVIRIVEVGTQGIRVTKPE